MTEVEQLRALPLADRLRIAEVDLAITGAPPTLVEAVWVAGGHPAPARPRGIRRYEWGRTHESGPIQVASYHFAQSAGALPCG
jgi:hypothetical protein